MYEEIVSFIRDEDRPYVFFLEMTGISYCDGSYRIARKNSQITVIEYVIQGRGTVVTDGNTFTASAGDIYLLHRGSTHCYISDGDDPWVKIWMNVGGPLVDSLVLDYGISNVNHVRGLDIKSLFEEVLSAARSFTGDSNSFFTQAALAFHRMAAAIHAAARSQEDSLPPEAARLKRWLDRRIYEKAEISEFAAHIFRSPSQAIRIFKKQFGTTPYDYLLGKRIETAKLLLRNTNLPVKEIAYRLNFADEHYFSNYFKKRAGTSPAKYRGR
jgi:AraC family transcriptional regulator of arabinose operon